MSLLEGSRNVMPWHFMCALATILCERISMSGLVLLKLVEGKTNHSSEFILGLGHELFHLSWIIW